jgi:hypothetical protein
MKNKVLLFAFIILLQSCTENKFEQAKKYYEEIKYTIILPCDKKIKNEINKFDSYAREAIDNNNGILNDYQIIELKSINNENLECLKSSINIIQSKDIVPESSLFRTYTLEYLNKELEYEYNFKNLILAIENDVENKLPSADNLIWETINYDEMIKSSKDYLNNEKIYLIENCNLKTEESITNFINICNEKYGINN